MRIHVGIGSKQHDFDGEFITMSVISLTVVAWKLDICTGRIVWLVAERVRTVLVPVCDASRA